MKTDKFVLAALFAKASSAKDCSGKGGKVDCGYSGINQSECEQKGCCWVPVETQNPLFLAIGQEQSQPDDTPWCFNAGSGPGPTPPSPGG